MQKDLIGLWRNVVECSEQDARRASIGNSRSF